MKASELRIGNLVNHNVFGNCQITALDYEMICIQRNDLDIKEWFDLDVFKPIKTTKDRLVDLGFEQYNSKWWNKSILWIDPKDVTICIGDEFKQVNIRNQKNFIHQIQNLYFSLTGVELQLSSNVT